MASRIVKIERKTRETDISLTLDPDAAAEPAIRTGIPFFDHLLTSMSFHGRFSLSLEGQGDIDVDPHHLVEDVGLVLGQAFSSVFEKAGSVARFGHAVVPMDEALSEVTIDVCGRPTLSLHASFPQAFVGTFDMSLLREFLAGLSSQARISLHVDLRRGENSHHMAESAFKALGKALKQAYSPDGRDMSSKGRIG
ncbi:MAG: imidazoleglycerol-phosphate dehydratase HisB [Spirochaetia bacterium]